MVGVCRDVPLLVEVRNAGGAAIGEDVNSKTWRRRRRRRLLVAMFLFRERGAYDRNSMSHGGRNLRGADNATHGAPEQQYLRSRIQGLVLDHVLGNVGVFGVCLVGEDDELWVVFCTCVCV